MSLAVCLGITIVLVALTSREDLETIKGTLKGGLATHNTATERGGLETNNTATFQQKRELLHAKNPASPKEYAAKNLKKDFKIPNAHAFQEDSHEKGTTLNLWHSLLSS